MERTRTAKSLVRAARFPNLVDGANVRVVQRRCRASLPQQPRPSGGVGQCLGGESLQGYVAVQLLVVGAIDFAHPACTNSLEDAIVTELLA
jgi:hypothetical protein